MRDSGPTRRAFAAAVGTVAAGALAGCTGSGTEQMTGEDGSGDESTAAPTETATDASTSASGGGEASFDGWFDDVNNYDGVVDETGNSEVTVAVGASGNGGNYAFDPAAVRVDSGATVVWEWTGKGASHNVVAEQSSASSRTSSDDVAEDDSFESEMVTESGHTFEHTFEEAGTYEYVCTPHRAMGMKGAVVVE